MTGGVRGSHALAQSMAGSGDMALRTCVAMAVELIMTHPVAMETGSPVAYVRVGERFIVLGQGQIRRVGRAWVVGDVEIVAHAPPAMVLFFLFLFLPLTFAFVLTAVAVLCKPGCAVSAADTSSV